MKKIFIRSAIVILSFSASTMAFAQTRYETWPPLKNPFESTSGGGVMIDGYNPVVGEKDGRKVCTTDFSVKDPNGPPLYSSIVFEAVDTQGGILCTRGKWRMKDGSGEGTTPFEVFIKDGVQRRSP